MLLSSKPCLDALHTKLGSFQPKLGAQLRFGHTKLGSRLGQRCLLGLCAHRRLGRSTGKTRSFQPKLGAQLRFGHTKLGSRLRKLRGLLRGLLLLLKSCQPKLRALKTHDPRHFCATETDVGAKLRARLLTAKRLLKRRLRTLRGAFKALCPHLRSRSSLLLHNVPLQFLLRNRLARSAKGSCANRLCPQPCARDVALAADVGERLLHCRIFKLAHKGLNAARIVKVPGSSQGTNPSSGYVTGHLPRPR